jgi:hypothetical protein
MSATSRAFVKLPEESAPPLDHPVQAWASPRRCASVVRSPAEVVGLAIILS